MSEAPARPSTLLICCGSLAKEITALVRENGWDHMRVQCLPAHIHNTPEQIPHAVRRQIHEARDEVERIFVLFSDCGTGGRLDQVLKEEGVERIGGAHCYEAFFGFEDYAALIKAEPGCFFLTDFLVRHFDRLIVRGLGLDRYPKLRGIYFDRYKKLVYLAQSPDPALRAKAAAAAESLGLDLEVRVTGYGEYEKFLADREPAQRRTDMGSRTPCTPCGE